MPGRSEGRVGEDRHPAGPGDARRAESAPGGGAERRGPPPRRPRPKSPGRSTSGRKRNRLYLLGSGFGIDLKLVLTLITDPESGGLIVSANLPKFPISKIALRLYPSAGLLRTAVRCGEYPVQSTVSTWNALARPLRRDAAADSIDSGPGATPCPGPAAQAHVALSPSQLPADGKSTTTARVTVADGAQVPVPGEVVEFSSSDPDLQIGPVTDNEDGSYSAELTASNTIGTPTITATVTSVDPEITGSAPLHLVSPSSPASPPPVRPVAPKIDPIPKMKIGKHPPARTRRHRALVSFSADVPGSTFFCKVDGRAVFRPCTSPAKLSGLTVGRHRLSVYAVGPTGATGVPAVVRFTVLPPKPKAGLEHRLPLGPVGRAGAELEPQAVGAEREQRRRDGAEDPLGAAVADVERPRVVVGPVDVGEQLRPPAPLIRRCRGRGRFELRQPVALARVAHVVEVGGGEDVEAGRDLVPGQRRRRRSATRRPRPARRRRG